MEDETTTQEVVSKYLKELKRFDKAPRGSQQDLLVARDEFVARFVAKLRDPSDFSDLGEEMLRPLRGVVVDMRVDTIRLYKQGFLDALNLLLDADRVYQLKLRAGHELGEKAFAILSLILQGGGSASLRHIEIVYDLSKRGCALHVSALERAGFVDKPREDIANYVQITADGRRFLEAVESGQIRA